MYKGIPQNDIGLRTDVMDNVNKSLGMKIAVRTMAPQVIVADEIGTKGGYRCYKLWYLFRCKRHIYSSWFRYN